MGSKTLTKIFSRHHEMLAAIIGVGFGLRFLGLGFGLPYIYSDEPTFVVPATQMLANRDPNPHWFGHPASLLIYLLAFLFAGFSAAYALKNFFQGEIVGWQDVDRLFSAHMYREFLRPSYYFCGRLFIVFLALATIYLVYRVGKKLAGRPAGLLGAFCLAIAPLHIQYSRLIRTDVPSTLLVILSQLFLLKSVAYPSRLGCLWASAFFVGWAAATKYTTGLAILPVLVWAFMKEVRGLRLPRVDDVVGFFLLRTAFSRALAWAFAGFFMAAPYVILDFKSAIFDILAETESSHLGADRFPGLMNHAWYLTDVLRKGIGGAFFEWMAFFGAVVLLIKKSRQGLFFLLFPAAYFIAMGFASIRFDRWFVVVLPFGAAAFGVGFWEAFRCARERMPSGWRRKTTVAALGGLLAFFFMRALAVDLHTGLKLARSDTRTLAKEWAEANLPQRSKIAYEDYAPQFEILNRAHFVLVNRGEARIVSKPLSYYTDAGVNYIVITDSIWSRIYAEPKKYPVEIARYGELKRKAALVKTFSPEDNPGPIIEFYRLAQQ